MKKKKIKTTTYNFQKEYIIPMVPSEYGRIKSAKFAEPVQVEIKYNKDKGDIIVTKDGYQSLYFYDFYFDYLLATSYIKKVKV